MILLRHFLRTMDKLIKRSDSWVPKGAFPDTFFVFHNTELKKHPEKRKREPQQPRQRNYRKLRFLSFERIASAKVKQIGETGGGSKKEIYLKNISIFSLSLKLRFRFDFKKRAKAELFNWLFKIENIFSWHESDLIQFRHPVSCWLCVVSRDECGRILRIILRSLTSMFPHPSLSSHYQPF